MKNYLSLVVIKYLRFFARLQLKKNHPLIIGITGSAGKTSTKHALAATLQHQYHLKISYKANSETGIPLNILGLSPQNYSLFEWLKFVVLTPIKLLTNWEKFDVYLVEMAVDSPNPPKNMDYLLTILKPSIGIFLNAHPMHSEPFDYLVKTKDLKKRKAEITKLIATEKGKLITRLPKTGLAVLNYDDVNVRNFARQTKAKVSYFGQSKSADLRVIAQKPSLKGTRVLIEADQKEVELNLAKYLLPQHYGYTLAAALAVARYLGMELQTAGQQLEQNFKLPPGRASLIKGIHQSWILDSSYNASAKPMLDALELVKQIAPKRKLALLGDMRELGQETQLEHELVAKKAAQVCDLVVLVGPAMKQFALPVLEKIGFKDAGDKQVRWVEDAYQAAEFLKKILQPQDLLLVKGSQNTLLLEIAIAKLMAQPNKAKQLLCRRGEFWDQKRVELKSG